MSPATMALSMEQDAALRERFAKLLRDHGPGLRRVARAYARRPAEAADLEQDIALAIWRALPGFRGDASERTFVFRIGHNRGISHAEARRLRDMTTPLVDDAPSLIDGRPPADEALDHTRRRDSLWRAIGELPVGARSVLTLALEGLSHEEIAEVLGTSTNSVAVRLSRARTELRTLLGDER
jgi:RNA polymerase sigma-70 factor (ECF subfamily)